MVSDASLLPRLANPLLTWKDVGKSATVFGAVNFVMLLFWMEVPLMILAIQYGGYMALAAGLAGSKLKLVDSADLDAASTAFVAQLRELFGLFLDLALLPVVRKLAPIVLWTDTTTSMVVLLCIYVLAGVVTTIGLFECAFLAFNAVFLYGKFQLEIIRAGDPHLMKAKKFVMDLVGKIPKYEAPAGGAAAAAKKAVAPAPAPAPAPAAAKTNGGKKNSPKKEPAAAAAAPSPKKESVESEEPTSEPAAAPVSEPVAESAKASTSEH